MKRRTGRRKKRASTLFLGWNGGMKENTSIYLPPPLMCLILQAQLVTTQTLFFCQVQRCPELSPLTLLLSVPDFQDVFSGLSLKTLSSKLLHPRCPSILTQLLSISPSPGNLRGIGDIPSLPITACELHRRCTKHACSIQRRAHLIRKVKKEFIYSVCNF